MYRDRQILKEKTSLSMVKCNCPSSCKKSTADLLNVPCDSMAIDKNAYLWDKSSSFTSLRLAADSAALPAVIVIVGK